MEKIALITDTTSDLSEEFIKEYNIQVLPFRIIYKDREYLDKVNITPEEVYEGFKKEVPTSSMPSMDDMENLFKKLEDEGYTHAIAIVLSTGLSGIYNGIKIVSESHPKINTLIWDSKSISLGEGAQVINCGKLIKKGLSFEEIKEEIPKFYEKVHLYFVVGTLDYLKKGGRIGKVSGTIGELLNIKPIVSPDKNGVYATVDKVRGRKQSLNRLVDIAKGHLKEHKCIVYVMHGDALEDSNWFYDNIKSEARITSMNYGGCISPVSGVHSGPGLVGLVMVEDD